MPRKALFSPHPTTHNAPAHVPPSPPSDYDITLSVFSSLSVAAPRIQGPKRPASSALRSDLDGWFRLSADDRHQSRTSIPNRFPFDYPTLGFSADPAVLPMDVQVFSWVRRGVPSFVKTPPSENFTRKSTLSSHGCEVDPLSPNRRYPSLLFFVASS